MIMGGFYIPLKNMHAVVRWISWLSFAAYGYISMLVNEFSGRDIPCVENTDEIPISIGGSGDKDRVCPMPGDQVLEGLGIEGLQANYWFNILLLVALQAFFRASSYAILRKSK